MRSDLLEREIFEKRNFSIYDFPTCLKDKTHSAKCQVTKKLPAPLRGRGVHCRSNHRLPAVACGWSQCPSSPTLQICGHSARPAAWPPFPEATASPPGLCEHSVTWTSLSCVPFQSGDRRTEGGTTVTPTAASQESRLPPAAPIVILCFYSLQHMCHPGA